LASPVPPGAARVYPGEIQTDTGRAPPEKYAAAGEAMRANRYCCDGWLMPSPVCVAIMNGRR
jgi:hypothetical protein